MFDFDWIGLVAFVFPLRSVGLSRAGCVLRSPWPTWSLAQHLVYGYNLLNIGFKIQWIHYSNYNFEMLNTELL